jgi:hypothetical protein
VSTERYDKLPVRVRAEVDTLPAWYFGRARQIGPRYEVDFAPDLPVTLPHGQLRQIDVMVGRRAGAGALIGALASGAIMIHAIASCSGDNKECIYCGDCTFLPATTPFAVAAGTAIGAVIGWTIPHWVRVGP